MSFTSKMSTSSSSAATELSKSWKELQQLTQNTLTGEALTNDKKQRELGLGVPHVHNKLRLFSSSETTKSKITLYRDHAGWCPYCEKTMLLVEEKQIPINIELVNMRSYGDKPREFLQIVPNGLLPALGVDVDGRKQVITESQVIMELLDDWFSKEDGYKVMMPEDEGDKKRYDKLARLERDLFSWWCTFLLRPEMPSAGNLFSKLTGGDKEEMSSSMKGFLDCLQKVDTELSSTSGPWFFDSSHPMMMDFIYISHIERMLASISYWKGFNIRDCGRYPALDAWLDAFDQRESYLAFKSDFYTNVKDIPPQYGPPYHGDRDEVDQYIGIISGSDGSSWKLPLAHDDPLQPLYRGLPLPSVVLDANDLQDYANADPKKMAAACRDMAAWKLASNGKGVAKFASRGGSLGAKNPRKTFAAELADPYAQSDENVLPVVENVLKVVCEALLDSEHDIPTEEYNDKLKSLVVIKTDEISKTDVVNSLKYLRDRIGVPRDLPLASARYLRAYLNWSIDVIA